MGLDVPSGRSAKRSNMLSSFTSLDGSLGKSVKRHIAPLAVLMIRVVNTPRRMTHLRCWMIRVLT